MRYILRVVALLEVCNIRLPPGSWLPPVSGLNQELEIRLKTREVLIFGA